MITTLCRKGSRSCFREDRGRQVGTVCRTSEMRPDVAHKFEDVEVWQRALEYADPVHEIVDELSKHAFYEPGLRPQGSALVIRGRNRGHHFRSEQVYSTLDAKPVFTSQQEPTCGRYRKMRSQISCGWI